ncbi:antimicrobial peptide 1-like [Leptopilina heterotoma]|uniref:antimicrobial peptide 1-like n=1 Tax=Leptopilina heterotoma TaxID=63436 RepID=UPI001CA81052|nr:antimicrobial peptide 1-like [Leptopilina heterotoma]
MDSSISVEAGHKMAGFKFYSLLLLLIGVILMMASPAISQPRCLQTGLGCQPWAWPPCCTGNCYKEEGWVAGVCR